MIGDCRRHYGVGLDGIHRVSLRIILSIYSHDREDDRLGPERCPVGQLHFSPFLARLKNVDLDGIDEPESWQLNFCLFFGHDTLRFQLG